VVSGRGKRDKLAVDKEALKPAFLAAGSKLQVRTLFIVYAEGPLSTSWTEVAYGLVHRYHTIYTHTSI
jgi:hypothetical protein